MSRHVDRGAAGVAEAGASATGWPIGPPRVWVAQMARSLDFYLGLGCAVRCTADGWALLCCGQTSFVLIQGAAPNPARAQPADEPIIASGWVRLTTPDVRALRRRLLTDGVVARSVIAPGNIAEIEVIDPDLHRVVIAEPGHVPRPLTTTMPRARPVTRPGPRSATGHLVSIKKPPAA